MDTSDEATKNEELRLTVAMSHRKPTLAHTGKCYECEALITGTFCCADCRETYEQRLKFKNTLR